MPQFIKVATTDELADQPAKLVELEGQIISFFHAAVRLPLAQSGCAGAPERYSRMWVEAREGASHGSPDRVPGALFRALAALFLRGHPDVVRGALARELSQRLASGGIHYHLGTLRRQLSGAVSTLPPEVETAMRQILRERDGLAGEEELERALAASGIEIPHGARASAHVMVERVLPLAELWLHLNPRKSKRFLALRLWNDLSREGRHSTVNSLQSVLAGKQRLVQRAVHQVLLGYLAELGVPSEEAASGRARELHRDIGGSLRRRSFVDASRFRQLCRVWQFRRHEPSRRRLAVLLKERLSRWGLSVNVKHLQKTINGESRRVRYAFLEAMEDILGEEVRDLRKGEGKLLTAAANEQVVADLRWVPAKPVAALAREWLAAHPGVSQRELARRLTETLARMGYCSSPSTIQPILGGRRKKTRGFIHRALLAPSGRPLSVEQNESTRAPNSRPERSLIRREPPAHVASVSAAGAGVSALRPLASSRLPARRASRASLRYSESGGGGPDPGTKAAAAPTRFGPAPHLRRPLTGLGPRGRHPEWLVTSRRFVSEMPRGDDERGMPRVWRTTETPWRNG